jgi:predicted NBD/HSP70 family sugar kinase
MMDVVASYVIVVTISGRHRPPGVLLTTLPALLAVATARAVWTPTGTARSTKAIWSVWERHGRVAVSLVARTCAFSPTTRRHLAARARRMVLHWAWSRCAQAHVAAGMVAEWHIHKKEVPARTGDTSPAWTFTAGGARAHCDGDQSALDAPLADVDEVAITEDELAGLVDRAVRNAQDLYDSRYAVGVELLPYRLIWVLIGGQGERIADGQRALAKMKASFVVREIATVVNELVPAAYPALSGRIAVAVQLGGPVDTKTGTVLFFHKTDPVGSSQRRPGFRWRSEALGPMLEEKIGFPVIVENDGDALATYQQWFGAGRGIPRFGVILVREGVGAGIIVDHELLNVPAEIGQLTAYDHGDLCDCGRRGCLESVAGIRGIVRRASEVIGRPISGVAGVAALAGDDDADAAQKALETFSAAGDAIARAIAHVVNMYYPTRLVLYVPAVMAEEGTPAADAFRVRANRFRKLTHLAFRNCELVIKPFGPYDGAHGAALIALRRCFGVTPAMVSASRAVRS